MGYRIRKYTLNSIELLKTKGFYFYVQIIQNPMACRAKSTADLLHKLAIVEEEGDETLYWLELLVEAHIFPDARLKDLIRETDEIVSMIVSSIKTIRSRQNNHKSLIPPR